MKRGEELGMPAGQTTTCPEGLEIKIARIRAGLLQYEVAARVGILANRLSEIESGRRQPSTELLKRILRVVKGERNGVVR